MAVPNPTPESEAEPESSPMLAPRAAGAREPISMLIVGGFLFVGVLVLVWMNSVGRPSTASFQRSISARTATYMTEMLFSWQVRGVLPAQYRLPVERQLAQLANQTAGVWQETRRLTAQPSDRARMALNAMALHGVADDLSKARAALARAITDQPADAAVYRAFAPLYAPVPHAVAFSPAANRVLDQLSSGPLIRARNALLRQDTPAAIAALRPGERAGLRALIVNAVTGLLVLGIFLTALITTLVGWRRIRTTLQEAKQQAPPHLPWGIGTALAVISGAHLLTFTLTSLFLHLPGMSTSARLVVAITATPVSTVIVLGIFLLSLGHTPWHWDLFGWRPVAKSARTALVTLLLTLPLVWLATLISALALGGERVEANPIIDRIMTMHNPVMLIYVFLAVTVMAPLVEETLYRGILFRALGARMSFWSAALTSGLLFSLMHGQLVAILPITVLGTAMALLVQRTRSLLASATLHAAYNGMTAVLVLLQTWVIQSGPGTRPI